MTATRGSMRRSHRLAIIAALIGATATWMILSSEAGSLGLAIWPGWAVAMVIYRVFGAQGHAMGQWFMIASITNAIICGALAFALDRIVDAAFLKSQQK